MPKNINTPIPDTEIEGVGVFCYQLEIPDTRLWHRTLYVLVSMLTRGRFWQKSSGSILDVQQIGNTVLNSLRPCDEQTPITDPETIDIINNITNNKGCKCMNCSCCTTQGEITTNTPDTQENILPEDIQTEIPQPTTTIPTDSGFQNFLCIWAKFTIDNLILAISEAANWVELADLNVEESTRIVFEKFGKWSEYVRPLQALYLLTTWLIRWLSPSVAAGLVAIIQENRGQLIDGVYCSGSAQEASDNWFDILVTNQSNLINKALFYIWLTMVDFEAFFQNTVTRMTFSGYAHAIDTYSTDCTCAADGGDAGLPVGYVLVPMISDDNVFVNGATLTEMGDLWEIMGQGNAFVDSELLEPVFDSMIVPNANRVGFFFVLESASTPNANSVSQRLVNSTTQFTQVNFGGGVNTFLPEEIFAGVIVSDATMQTWLMDNTFRYEDPACTTDTGDVVMSWGFNGGTANTGEINEFVLRANWIINTAGL